MKSTQPKKIVKKETDKNHLLKNSIIAGIIGFLSWLLIFIFWDPLASLYKFENLRGFKFFEVLGYFNIYKNSFFIGFLFFLFFYFTLKYKEKSSFAKFIMWAGIILYTLFYLGYLFLLFFFRFTDL